MFSVMSLVLHCQGESPRLSGRALVALATTQGAMTSRSGQVAVVAEVLPSFLLLLFFVFYSDSFGAVVFLVRVQLLRFHLTTFFTSLKSLLLD